jgi:hypothetical protein
MQALQETTVWAGALAPNHVYLLDGTNLVAYIRNGTTEPYWFKSPIKGFSKSGRKFVELKDNPFGAVKEPDVMPWIRRVQSSKPGVFYTVNTEENTCTCQGFTFRGTCKHVKELATVK